MLLTLEAECVDFVDVEDTFVCSVDGACFDELVWWCFKSCGLEGVMAYVAEKCTGVCCGCVNEGWGVFFFMADKYLRYLLKTAPLCEAATSDDEIDHYRGDNTKDGVFKMASVDSAKK